MFLHQTQLALALINLHINRSCCSPLPLLFIRSYMSVISVHHLAIMKIASTHVRNVAMSLKARTYISLRETVQPRQHVWTNTRMCTSQLRSNCPMHSIKCTYYPIVFAVNIHCEFSQHRVVHLPLQLDKSSASSSLRGKEENSSQSSCYGPYFPISVPSRRTWTMWID